MMPAMAVMPIFFAIVLARFVTNRAYRLCLNRCNLALCLIAAAKHHASCRTDGCAENRAIASICVVSDGGPGCRPCRPADHRTGIRCKGRRTESQQQCRKYSFVHV